MTLNPEHIPHFQSPKQTQVGELKNLLNENFIEESGGIQYNCFRVINPVDKLEISKSNSVEFIWKDENAYLNSSKCYLEIEFYATKEDGTTALTPTEAVSALNPTAHCLLDTVQVNIGETVLEENIKMNQFLTKFMYLQQYTKTSQQSFLTTMERSYLDIEETLTTDIASCLTSKEVTTGTGENAVTKTVYEGKNTQGKVCLDLTDKKKTCALIIPVSAMVSLDTLIPSNIDVSWRFQIANGTLTTISIILNTGLAGLPRGGTYGGTDVRTENLPILQNFVLYRGRCPAS